MRCCSFVFWAGSPLAGRRCWGPCTSRKSHPRAGADGWWAFFNSTWLRAFYWHIFSNYLIGLQEFGIDTEWRWKLGISAVPAALFFMLLFTIPRSPRWLVKKQRIAEARDVLRLTGEPNYEEELRDIVASIDAEHGLGDEPLFQRKYRLPIFLAISIGMFNQLAGINAILYYLNDIFAYAGFSKVSGDLQAVALGFTN
jgi:SP family arabinose:H+ symporter-like MFS transporter